MRRCTSDIDSRPTSIQTVPLSLKTVEEVVVHERVSWVPRIYKAVVGITGNNKLTDDLCSMYECYCHRKKKRNIRIGAKIFIERGKTSIGEDILASLCGHSKAYFSLTKLPAVQIFKTMTVSCVGRFVVKKRVITTQNGTPTNAAEAITRIDTWMMASGSTPYPVDCRLILVAVTISQKNKVPQQLVTRAFRNGNFLPPERPSIGRRTKLTDEICENLLGLYLQSSKCFLSHADRSTTALVQRVGKEIFEHGVCLFGNASCL